MPANTSRRASGTDTVPSFGSIVQKGKFSAAMPFFVRALNRVDLPTLGKPTMPQLMLISYPLGKQLNAYRVIYAL
jgi:hypothetical protein